MSEVKSFAYYTPESLADLLVSLIPINRVKCVLDLCVGSGNLLWAAGRKWPSALLIGVDVDGKAVAICRKRFKKPATFLIADARLMHPNMPGKPIELTDRTFDIVLANPPFAGNREAPTLILNENHDSENRYLETLPEKWESLSRRVEAMLLVYNLLYVRPGGYLAAIIPDSILSCDRFVTLRDWLIRQSQRLMVVKLPGNSFSQTEVAASALILKRAGRSTWDFLPNFVLQEAQLCRDKLSRRTLYRGAIDGSCNRLDSACIPDSYSASHDIKLADLTSYIKRGTFIPKCSLRVTGAYLYIHSTHIKNDGLDIATAPRFINAEMTKSEVPTECGDILLVRVGKTFGRIGIITKKEQNGFISSCLYLVRPKGMDSYSLALLLQSRAVQAYYRKVARGSAAKFLTYSDIQATPISLVSDGFLKVLAERYKEIIDSSAVNSNEKNDKALRTKQLLKELDSRLDALKINQPRAAGSESTSLRNTSDKKPRNLPKLQSEACWLKVAENRVSVVHTAPIA